MKVLQEMSEEHNALGLTGFSFYVVLHSFQQNYIPYNVFRNVLGNKHWMQPQIDGIEHNVQMQK